MMLSGATWALLILGGVLSRRWAFLDRHGSVLGPVAIGLALVVDIVLGWTTVPLTSSAWLTTALALCALTAWGVTLRRTASTVVWGGVAWSLGGLLVLGQTHDLLVLGLGWEILRHGVRVIVTEDAMDQPDGSVWLLSFGWWTAVGALLLFGGTTDITALMHLARQLYTPVNQAEPLGRASLVMVGAMALLTVTVCAAMLLPTPADHRDNAGPRYRAACGRMHLQFAAGLILGVIFQTGCPGVSGPLTDLVSVLTVVTWVLAVIALGRTQRWCELVDAAVRLQGGMVLFATWLLLAEKPHPLAMPGTLVSSAPAGFLWGQELLHGAVALTALFAALSWRSADESPGPDFIEASRGAATVSPLPALWTLLPLASLIGCPGLWGGWVRLATGAAVFSVQSMREDELAIPVGSIIVVAAAGWLATGYLLRGTIHVISVLCWEPLIGRPRPPGNGWPQVLAAGLSVGLLIVGCYPALVTTVVRWIAVRSLE